MIKAAIFDLDGTLLDSLYVWARVDFDFLGKRGFEVPDDYGKKIASMGFREVAIYTNERFGLGEDIDDILAEWNELARDKYHNEVKLKPGVKELLERFKKNGLLLGIATSSNHELYEKCLENNGVAEYFHSITETKEVGKGKKFADVYLREAEKMGVLPEECIVFEDLEEGLVAAREAGFKTAVVYDSESAADFLRLEEQMDYAIRDFSIDAKKIIL
ncbi:MAG: HAD family phosphatase [Eubacterium sp.]|nr:HAD family phosphatase [Eubacterium sp.]